MIVVIIIHFLYFSGRAIFKTKYIRFMQVKPLSLTWKNLNASVKDKPILHDATGYCRSGEMLAIMGPSGSGKTTILSLLSHKTDPIITVSGTVSNPPSRSQPTTPPSPLRSSSTSAPSSTKTTSSTKPLPSEVTPRLSRNAHAGRPAQIQGQQLSPESNKRAHH